MTTSDERTELDPATERIVNYLGETHEVPINAAFFRYFKEGEHKYLARTWLIDPDTVEAKEARTSRSKTREPCQPGHRLQDAQPVHHGPSGR